MKSIDTFKACLLGVNLPIFFSKAAYGGPESQTNQRVVAQRYTGSTALNLSSGNSIGVRAILVAQTIRSHSRQQKICLLLSHRGLAPVLLRLARDHRQGAQNMFWPESVMQTAPTS